VIEALHFAILPTEFSLNSTTVLRMFNCEPERLFAKGISLKTNINAGGEERIAFRGGLAGKEGNHGHARHGGVSDVLLRSLQKMEGVLFGNAGPENHEIAHADCE
jgi:hypothetical protein